MKKKKRRKTDREVLKEIFPPQIVEEIDRTISELDGEKMPRKNPPRKRPLKPWGRKWVEEMERDKE